MYITTWLIRPPSRFRDCRTHVDPPNECGPKVICVEVSPILVINVGDSLCDGLALVLKMYDFTDLLFEKSLLGRGCDVISVLKKGGVQ